MSTSLLRRPGQWYQDHSCFQTLLLRSNTEHSNTHLTPPLHTLTPLPPFAPSLSGLSLRPQIGQDSKRHHTAIL